MTVSVYTTRITNENGKITAWIDKDGFSCIEQPNHPNQLHTGQNWSSEEEATSWANDHADYLTQLAIDAENQAVLDAQTKEEEAAARQALISSASKLDEIHAMLTQLTTNN